MSQLARDRDRVHIGAHVDRRQAERLVELARERDRSVSSILRIAIARELARTSKDVGATAAAAPHTPATERRAPDSPAVEAQALAGEER
jgi:hypothetical protein